MKRLMLVTALAALTACDTTVAPEADDLSRQLAAVSSDSNFEMAQSPDNLLMYSAEYITAPGSEELGRTIFFNAVGNKQLPHHFVEGDTRRSWNADPQQLTIALDGVEGSTSSGLSQADTNGAILDAMDTWRGVRCSTMTLMDLGPSPFDIGYVEYLLAGSSVGPFIFADVSHSGFLPAAFFDLLAPGGSNFILGVTFTFIFTFNSGPGTPPTDIDNDGKADTAFRDIYYNDNFSWAIGSGGIDVETVALHEAGHGLSQAHFGTAFRTDANSKVHFAPRAVMNAAYSGVQTSIRGTDLGGHCSIWASWGAGEKK
jgi:hypothetical protein